MTPIWLDEHGCRRPTRAEAVLVLALGLALYLPGLGREILRYPLEAKYALVARGMLRGDPLLVAHDFGRLYPDKPPLYFWATALLGWLQGGHVGELTARLPAAGAALVVLLAVHRLGRDLFGGQAGLLAAAVLATSNLFFWYARQGHPDQFLTASVTLACLGLWRSFTAPTSRGALGWTAFAYVGMAFGVLSKGLLALVLPLLAGAAYLLATGPARVIPARLRLVPGLAVFLPIVLAWFGPAVARYGRGYLYETAIRQHVGRYTATWAHPERWYFYLGEFPAGFAPWVAFLPGAIVLGWRARRAGTAGAGTAAGAVDATSPVLFPLGWFAVGFLFFSLASAKRGPYLLPLYPAAALLVGWLWEAGRAARVPAAWLTVPIRVMSGAAALLAVGLLLVPRRTMPGRRTYMLVPSDPGHLAAVVGLLLAAAAAVWLLWDRGRRTAAFGILVAVQAVGLLTVAAVRPPQYEALFPVRAFAARVQAVVAPREPVFLLVRPYRHILAFYVDRPVVLLAGPAELLAAARTRTRPTYAIVTDEQRAEFGNVRVHTLAQERIDRKRMALVRLDPPPPPRPVGHWP